MDLSNKLTKLTKSEWRDAANKLKIGNYEGVDYSVPYGQAKKYLGIPYWDQNEDPVTERDQGQEWTPTSGGGRVKMVLKTKRQADKRAQQLRRIQDLGIDPEAIKWLQETAEKGLLEAGKSVEDFISQRVKSNRNFLKIVKLWEQATGIPLDDGHMTERSNNSPEARAPEISRINQSKREAEPISPDEMRRANLPTNDLEDAVNYAAGSKGRGTNAQLGIKERAMMLNQGMSADQAVAIADRNQQLQIQSQPSVPQSKLRILRSAINYKSVAPTPSSSSSRTKSKPRRNGNGNGGSYDRTSIDGLGTQNGATYYADIPNPDIPGDVLTLPIPTI